MPSAPQSYCAAPGCPTLVTHGRCAKHKRDRQQQSDSRRGSSRDRGYTTRWDKASKAFINEHPLCRLCEEAGLLEPATCTDHVIPHKGNPALFWDPRNWQALCGVCHGRKTATEDGGFGRRAIGFT